MNIPLKDIKWLTKHTTPIHFESVVLDILFEYLRKEEDIINGDISVEDFIEELYKAHKKETK